MCSLYSSLASWRSEVGVWYKIHVRSWPGYQSGVPIDVNLYDGFNFKVTCAAAPQNDYCNSAEVSTQHSSDLFMLYHIPPIRIALAPTKGPRQVIKNAQTAHM